MPRPAAQLQRQPDSALHAWIMPISYAAPLGGNDMGRAATSGRRLSHDDASIVLGMVARGDRHHDIAAWFGVNQGRVAEVIAGDLHPGTSAAPAGSLPPPGPYTSGRSAHKAITALEEAKETLENAAKSIEQVLKDIRRGV
jgi:hypothetical protein